MAVISKNKLETIPEVPIANFPLIKNFHSLEDWKEALRIYKLSQEIFGDDQKKDQDGKASRV